MARPNFQYIISLQYLGFRYHGWQRQPEVKTVQLMIERTLHYIIPDISFKVLSASRTDAMVSANEAAIALMTSSSVPNDFMERFNTNLPQDIKATSIKPVQSDNFNIIQTPKEKEYLYLFACGQKAHPFAASLVTTFADNLNISTMQQGAALFNGRHSFHNFCYKPSESTQFVKEITCSEIVTNNFYTASFFPEETFAFRIKGSGFLRHQIRMMMGALHKLGSGEYSLSDIQNLLKGPSVPFWHLPLAPASGLILQSTTIES